MHTEKLISREQYWDLLDLYQNDGDFCESIHNIYEVYETDKEVHENQRRILFFIKKTVREFGR